MPWRLWLNTTVVSNVSTELVSNFSLLLRDAKVIKGLEVSKLIYLIILKSILWHFHDKFLHLTSLDALLPFIYHTLILWFTPFLISKFLWISDSRYQKHSLFHISWPTSFTTPILFLLLLNIRSIYSVLDLV